MFSFCSLAIQNHLDQQLLLTFCEQRPLPQNCLLKNHSLYTQPGDPNIFFKDFVSNVFNPLLISSFKIGILLKANWNNVLLIWLHSYLHCIPLAAFKTLAFICICVAKYAFISLICKLRVFVP